MSCLQYFINSQLVSFDLPIFVVLHYVLAVNLVEQVLCRECALSDLWCVIGDIGLQLWTYLTCAITNVTLLMTLNM